MFFGITKNQDGLIFFVFEVPAGADGILGVIRAFGTWLDRLSTSTL